MVVCKCRKATKLYCFVHKTPLCLDCICSAEHNICVVGLYSDWVNDGDYDWPPNCSICTQSLDDGSNPTVRLGCLHNVHSSCLDRHFSSYPPYTAPAGYVCPSCNSTIWPPKSQKEAATTLFSNLRTVISKSSVSAILMATSAPSEKPPPPAFSGAPLVGTPLVIQSGGIHTSSGVNPSRPAHEIEEVNQSVDSSLTTSQNSSEKPHGAADDPSGAFQRLDGASGSLNMSPTPKLKPAASASSPVVVALPRKPASRVVIDVSGDPSHARDSYEDDDDGSDRKYARRGTLYTQFLRYVGSIWAPALKALPRTMPAGSRNDAAAEELVEGRTRRRLYLSSSRSSQWDPKKLLLALLLLSGMATLMLLYYRFLQGFVTGGNRSSTETI